MLNGQGGSTHDVYAVQEGEPPLAPKQETRLIQVVPTRISSDLSAKVRKALMNCLRSDVGELCMFLGDIALFNIFRGKH